MEIQRHTFEEFASLIDGDVDTDYSGRNMFGRTCPGVVHDKPDLLVGAMLVAACMESEDDGDYELALEIAGDARTDNMGRSTITYFPSLTLVDSGE